MSNRVILLIALILTVSLDWLSKALAIELLPTAELYYNAKEIMPLGLIFLFLLLATLLLIADNKLINAGAGTFVGAMVANNTDRFLRGPVLDFIPVPGTTVVCNLADLALLAASALIIIGLFQARATGQLGSRLPWARSLKRSSAVFLFFAVASAVFVIDWTTKSLALQVLPAEDIFYNSRSVLWILLIPAIIAYLYFLLTERDNWLIAALALLAGGGVANISDRILSGSVVDFIALDMPISQQILYINMADLALLIGVVVFICRSSSQVTPLGRSG